MHIELDDRQSDAAMLMQYYKTGIITGGPGTGKTQTVLAVLQQCQGKKIALVAPTGKAARRLVELTGHTASTIHRLLGITPHTKEPAYGPGNPLPYDIVIVDEASMLGIPLCAMLLGATDPDRTAVFFVGDVNQLPSIDEGNILEDLIRSGVMPTVYLDTVHRAAAGSWICRMAPRILKGEFDFTEADDFKFYECDEDDVEANTASVVSSLIKQVGEDCVQVLAPMNVGDHGAHVLNAVLQAELNPRESESFASNVAPGISHRVKVGDRVIAVANDYERAVFNGEIGYVREIYGTGSDAVSVEFADRDARYSKTEANENLRLAYALSTHKYQGSEVPWVVFVAHEEHANMLTRRLFYTALTRAKKGVVIVGQKSAVLRAVHTPDTTTRITTLRQRTIQWQRELIK